MSATIKDIAKIVGVSPSTVSRVINGTAPISDEVTAKIREAMKELDYHPTPVQGVSQPVLPIPQGL